MIHSYALIQNQELLLFLFISLANLCPMFTKELLNIFEIPCLSETVLFMSLMDNVDWFWNCFLKSRYNATFLWTCCLIKYLCDYFFCSFNNLVEFLFKFEVIMMVFYSCIFYKLLCKIYVWFCMSY